MARLPRFYIPGVPLHVIQRGNDRQAMFHGTSDRRLFLGLLREGSRRCSVEVHAYVLMPNHVHVLATPANADAMPRMMQWVGCNYVRWFNDCNGRTGTLWEGRYRASAVEHERYLLTCMRYIELNAVRAGIVGAAADDRWSSYRCNALGVRDALVRPHAVYLGLGATPERRAVAYREMFDTPVTDAELALIRDATQNAWVIGDPAFCARVGAVGRRAVRLPVGRPRKQQEKFESDPNF
jgi:putative transposase